MVNFFNLNITKYVPKKEVKINKTSGDSGTVEEEVGIENWDTDTIVQFLDEKIQL